MGRTRKKNRISSKIDELPSEIKGQVDVMLSDTSNSYQDVSGWLKEKGCTAFTGGPVPDRGPGKRGPEEPGCGLYRGGPDADDGRTD